jgi:hypothetical protein
MLGEELLLKLANLKAIAKGRGCEEKSEKPYLFLIIISFIMKTLGFLMKY